MKLRTVRTLYYLLFLAIVAVMVLGYAWPLGVYIAACAAVLLAMMILLQTFWRCPLCGHTLGRMQMGSTVECPHCKKKLEV